MTKTFLDISTNDISHEIITKINPYQDILNLIQFQVKKHYLNFNISLYDWEILCNRIEILEFFGILINNSFKTIHLEKMKSLKYLYVGATKYSLFDNEDITKLPILNELHLN